MPDRLHEGREAYRRRAWADAFESLAAADRMAPLGGEDLERLATAAYLTRRDPGYREAIDRAHHAHVAAGDWARAARCAFWLALYLLLRGESGAATAWLARGRRLVASRACVEHGYLLLPEAEQQIAHGELGQAVATARAAADVADQFTDSDLAACARHVQGRALIRQGHVRAGLALLDDAMLPAVRGELSPIFTGLIYCSVLEACLQVYALDRAREWTSALAAWCEAQPQMVAFSSICRVHRAEVLRAGGDWGDAIAEARRACRSLPGVVDRPPAAAFYQEGEMHRLRGEFAAAEDAYRAASRLGHDPQPGLALLRLAQGRADAACAALERALAASTDPLVRATLLPACAEVLLTAGEIEAARRASDELLALAAAFDSDVLAAMANQASGAVDLADGRAQAALVSLRRAFDAWQRNLAPYEAARVRVLIGAACRAAGDDEGAELEFAAARAVFDRLGAAPDRRLLDARAAPATAGAAAGAELTARERQVLRLVAAGRTNRAIAAELSVSERTVDRHLSNILDKLDVSSRTAATAYAYEHKLL